MVRLPLVMVVFATAALACGGPVPVTGNDAAVVLETRITRTPEVTSNQTTARFEFEGNGSGFQCQLDGDTFADCVTGLTYSRLSEGPHDFLVRSRSDSGVLDATPASFHWVVDLLAPDTTITMAPPALTSAISVKLGFTSSDPGSTFQCQLDGAPYAACTSPAGYDALSDGVHVFHVRATDPAGNLDLSPATATFTIDTFPPVTRITTPPPQPSGTTVSIGFASNEAGSHFECSLDGAAFAACTSPLTLTALSLGDHQLGVRAIDPAGNTDPDPAIAHWTVDSGPPETTIGSHPASSSSSTTATFTFTSNRLGATFECALDGAPFAPCTSPAVYSPLSVTSHVFSVRASDAGMTDPTPDSFTWGIDQTPPDTMITSGPSNPSNVIVPSFRFVSTEPLSTFQCRLDGGGYQSCSSPKLFTGIAEGPHTFDVRAVDPAGNLDPTPASFAWTIDVTPPDTIIASAPPAIAHSATASFTVQSEAGASFQCSLDGAAFSACSAAPVLTGLGDGPHGFDVRAVDAAGNLDPSPAHASWIVDTGPPDTVVSSAPAAVVATASARFTFVSNEGGVTFECSLDGAVFAACPSPFTVTVAQGNHILAVRAIDAVLQPDPTPATAAWSYDLDECALGTAGCSAAARCLNRVGSFVCVGDDGLLCLDGVAGRGASLTLPPAVAALGATTLEWWWRGRAGATAGERALLILHAPAPSTRAITVSLADAAGLGFTTLTGRILAVRIDASEAGRGLSVRGTGLGAGFDETLWHHYALVLTGVTQRLFIDGVEQFASEQLIGFAGAVPSDPFAGTTVSLDAGASPLGTPRRAAGYLKDVRLSSGQRYTAPFALSYPQTADAAALGTWLINEGSGLQSLDSSGAAPITWSAVTWGTCP